MPVTPKKYEFQGEMMTIAEVQKIVPRLSHTAIAKHLRAGRNTKDAILNHRPALAARKGGWRETQFNLGNKSG